MSTTAIATKPATWLAGYIPDLPTPFGPKGEVDLNAFRGLCERQIEAGVSALVVCETAGEASTVSPAEQEAIIRTAVDVARGRARIIAGAGSNSTSQAIALTQRAEAAGADAVLSVVPYYNKPIQNGIYAHFRAIAGSTGLPMILQDVPSRTVAGLTDDTIARLAELPRIIGLKDATGDVTRPLRLRPRLGPSFRLLSGDDATAFAFMTQGGDGCVSVTSNVVPGLCRAMFLQWRRGRMPSAQRLAALVARVTSALLRETNPAPLKYALSRFGLMSPRVRLPLVEPTEATRREIEGALASVQLGYPDYMIAAADGLNGRGDLVAR